MSNLVRTSQASKWLDSLSGHVTLREECAESCTAAAFIVREISLLEKCPERAGSMTPAEWASNVLHRAYLRNDIGA